MPFGFFKKDDDSKERQLEQQASLLALESGGITTAATKRLKTMALANESFVTSTFNAGALLLAQQAGYRAITQVMGSAFVPIVSPAESDQSQSHEVIDVTTANNFARVTALNRLRLEAELLGADGVVEVKLVMRNFSWAKGVYEFTAVGTAITVSGKPDFSLAKAPTDTKCGGNSFFAKKPKSAPLTHSLGQGLVAGNATHLGSESSNTIFLSNLSGQEFWQIYQSGYWPTAIVAGNCSYYVAGDKQTRAVQSVFASGENQELECFSKGIYHCRHQATNRMKKETKVSGGEGAVGVKVESEIERITLDKGSKFTAGLMVHFTVIGTAVRSLPEGHWRDHQKDINPLMVIDLAKGRGTKNF